MMKKVFSFCFLAIWGVIVVQGQNALSDTINIDEVKVFSSRLEHLTSNTRKEKIEKEQLVRNSNNTIAEMLQKSTALNIKSYGTPGASASLSLRGAGSNHTQVNWNGFPINSVTLGSADLSALSAGSFNEVSLIYGASGALFGSGTFGGALNLGSDLRKVDRGLSGVVNLDIGSVNTSGAHLNLTHANTTMVYSGSLWGKQSDGDFKYFDYIAQKNTRRENADWYNHGTIQQLGWKISPKSYIDAGIWLQVKKLNLPAIVGSQAAFEEMQRDSVLRTFIRYRQVFENAALTVKAAWFNRDQHYTKRISEGDGYSINSRIKSQRWYVDINYRNYVTDWMSWDVGGIFTNTNADVSAYGTKKKEYDWALVNALRFYKNRWSGQLSIRKEWNTAFNSDWLLGGSVGYRVIPEKIKLLAALSQKFRKPTFNDRYWIPGGNKNLLPESGNSWELDVEATMIDLPNMKWQAVISGYHSNIDDMIVWRPQGAIWSPENYMSVKIWGADLSTKMSYQWQKLRWNSNFSFVLNNSDVKNDQEGNSKMLYAPKFSWNWNNEFALEKYKLGVNTNYIASRYYNERSKLKDISLINLWVEKLFQIDPCKLVVGAKVNNFLNEEYELVRSYPMPGRTWEVYLSFRF